VLVLRINLQRSGHAAERLFCNCFDGLSHMSNGLNSLLLALSNSMVQALESVRHPNICLFIGWCSQPQPAIVSEFMHRGSLFKLLRRRGSRPLEPAMQRSGDTWGHLADGVALLGHCSSN
jgi:serine/threonine protein kinase